MHLAAKVIHRDIDLGEIFVDVEILHLIGGGLPVGGEDAVEAGAEKRLDQALALGIVGDGGAVTGIGRVDEHRYPGRALLREVPEPHGVEVENNFILSRPC